MDFDKVILIFEDIISDKCLKKAVFSKPKDKTIIKKEAQLFKKGDTISLQITTYTSDNKALHENFALDNVVEILCDMLRDSFSQCNIMTTRGDCEIKVGKKSILIINKIKQGSGNIDAPTHIREHNREKQHLLSAGEVIPFLVELGIMDTNGRVYDKMQDKFKQINRFISLIDDVFTSFDTSKPINILDLCCGKSYLTFAVHYYFTIIKNVEVNIIGVDLKNDVIEYCNKTVKKLSLKGISFLHGDILKYTPSSTVDMVISLHACDIATDIVLASAVKWGTGIIFSSPCCQHELASQLDSETLEIITKYPILKQKLAEIATDALRGQLLECKGYTVQMIEFIDPENTPKNLLIRAVKLKKPLGKKEEERLFSQYNKLCGELSANPTMKKLLDS